MGELLELTVAQAAERIRGGELGADEYFAAYRDAPSAAPGLVLRFAP